MQSVCLAELVMTFASGLHAYASRVVGRVVLWPYSAVRGSRAGSQKLWFTANKARLGHGAPFVPKRVNHYAMNSVAKLIIIQCHTQRHNVHLASKLQKLWIKKAVYGTSFAGRLGRCSWVSFPYAICGRVRVIMRNCAQRVRILTANRASFSFLTSF